jgi:hypothetical protein
MTVTLLLYRTCQGIYSSGRIALDCEEWPESQASTALNCIRLTQATCS